MIAFPRISTTGPITKMRASTGRFKTDAFLLCADSLTLEFDASSSEVVGAHGEGRVEVHLLAPTYHDVYVAFAQSVVYCPRQQVIILNGWIGSQFLGQAYMPTTDGKLILPTNGAFFPSAEFSAAPESANAAPDPIAVRVAAALLAA